MTYPLPRTEKRPLSPDTEQIELDLDTKKAKHDDSCAENQTDTSLLSEKFGLEVGEAFKVNGTVSQTPGKYTIEGVAEEVNAHPSKFGFTFSLPEKVQASGSITIQQAVDVEQTDSESDPEALPHKINLNTYTVLHDTNFLGKDFKPEGYGGTVELSGVGYPIHSLRFEFGNGILEAQVFSGENVGTFRIVPASDGTAGEISWKVDRNKLAILCQ
ncbi:unnamed protein product [Orchesella dallaii]|uniref:Uncharacterized protein n=1 Tax=Orchesella dallaii TaxID=48710 RepID=A0ABP1QE45_9HEXA